MFLDQIAGYLEFLLEVYQIYSFHLFETIPRNELFCYAMVRNISVTHTHNTSYLQDTVAKLSIMLQVLASAATAYVRFCCVVNNEKKSEKNIFLTVMILGGFSVIINSLLIDETYSFLICR